MHVERFTSFIEDIDLTWALALNNATSSYMYPPPHKTCMSPPDFGTGFEQRY
jgi:hypothetical protein